MSHDKELNMVVAALQRRQLGEVFILLENYGYSHPETALVQTLNEIRSDYRLMADYWRKGYKDEHAEALYERLLHRTYRLTANTYLRRTLTKMPLMGAAYRKAHETGQDWTIAAMRHNLENYVGEMALLELEPPHKREERETELRRRHGKLMSDLFDHIRTSEQWSNATAAEYTSMLLSPTIDIADRLLIISAIMMGCMWVFDFYKWKTMADVYVQTNDEQCKQRALVGWTLAMGSGYDKIFGEQKAMVDAMLADEKTAESMVALQMQMVYSATAEKDNRTIHEEIMPELMKNNNLRITPNGIEEKDDDPMEDILDSGAEDRKIAEMEEQMKRMMDMQKSGADIYFGGFSQMKRFPFFDNVSNWLLPFSAEHPAIIDIYANKKDRELAKMVVDCGMFCDSDKYSFLLAFQQTIGRLPANIREMLATGQAQMGINGVMTEVNAEEKATPNYIRRMYLQNLYRFFKLYPGRDMFENPFGAVLLCNMRIYADTPLKHKAAEMAAFMLKRGLTDEALGVLTALIGSDSICSVSSEASSDIGSEGDFNCCMLYGYIYSNKHKDKSMAACWYGKAVDMQPFNMKALAGYGRALMAMGRHEEAERIFDRMLVIDGENASAMLNRAECLIYLNIYKDMGAGVNIDGDKGAEETLERYKKALEYLYRLDYEHPENIRVKRALAQALMHTGKLEQAEQIYEKLVAATTDHVALGVLKWIKGDVVSAAKLFGAYLSTVCQQTGPNDVVSCFNKEILKPYERFLRTHGITELDMMFMRDQMVEFVILH